LLKSDAQPCEIGYQSCEPKGITINDEADTRERKPMISAVVEWFIEDVTHKDNAGGVVPV
jgi:hypothetical protein